MDKNLVIVESPAKAQTIGRFLGKDFKVMSSFGHIRDLGKSGMSIDEETLEPTYVVPDEKKKVVAELRKAARSAETVWLASDEDREGEAIAWHLAVVLGLDVATTRRIVFHEITKAAIEHALTEPRTINMDLVNAQQARRVLDRIVGFKLSPVLWRKVRRGLSAGRVQSVAVRLIVEREQEIRNFTAEASFAIVGSFVLDDGTIVKGELNRRFESEAEALRFLEECRGRRFSIGEVQQKEVSRSPAPPFMTSTLQQEAARKFGFTVALTMQVAQTLYERGLITYMRTDSLNLSNLCLSTSKKFITEQLGARYSKTRRFHTRAKGAQEAHEAIRPTFVENQTIEGNTREQKLYRLIWQRTVASQMSDAIFDRTTASVLIDGRDEQFRLEGEQMKFDGFLKVYQASADDEASSEQDTHLLPPLAQGQLLGLKRLVAEERFTRCPVRYNEATLVHKLEELGIGRPSTYAPTISTIQQRGYVVRENRPGTTRTSTLLTLEEGAITKSEKREIIGADKQKLLPTDTGMVVDQYLETAFPEILDYQFTARVEQGFDLVARGEEQWTNLLHKFYEKLMPQVDRALEKKSNLRVGERVLGTDLATGLQVSVKIGRFGTMVQLGESGTDRKPTFASVPKGVSLDDVTLESALSLFRLPRTLGEIDGQEVKANNGRFGPYVQLGKLYASIPKGGDPLTITLEEACELIRKKQQADAAGHLRTFAEEPELEVRRGRFGPYIIYQGKNYRLPAALKERAAELTLDECRQVVSTTQPSAGRKGRTKTK